MIPEVIIGFRPGVKKGKKSDQNMKLDPYMGPKYDPYTIKLYLFDKDVFVQFLNHVLYRFRKIHTLEKTDITT